MRKPIILLLTCSVAFSCMNIENAPESKRATFIHLYEGWSNFTGVMAKEIPGGYAILGSSLIPKDADSDSVISFLIQTDPLGNKQNRFVYPGFSAKSFTIVQDATGAPSGYLLAGDSVEIIPGADPAANTEIYSSKILKVNTNGDILKTIRITDRDTVRGRIKIDFKTSAVTINDKGQIVMLGTYKGSLISPEKPFVVAFDNTLSSVLWTRSYDLFERNYVNAKSVHYINGNVIWASAILKPQAGFNDAFLAIPFIQETSVFQNNALFKENQSQLILAGDIQPARTKEFGFGVIGTYATTGAINANLFFLRVDVNGSIVPGSVRYFDGLMSMDNIPLVDETQSQTEDAGLALFSTNDGGFILGGSVLSTPTHGHGLRDIYLIKVDALGNPQWNRLIGGQGDEVVSSITETTDGHLLICGTNTLYGFSNIFLIKTDSHGNLRN